MLAPQHGEIEELKSVVAAVAFDRTIRRRRTPGIAAVGSAARPLGRRWRLLDHRSLLQQVRRCTGQGQQNGDPWDAGKEQKKTEVHGTGL